VIHVSFLLHGSYYTNPFAIPNFVVAISLLLAAVWELASERNSPAARHLLFFCFTIGFYFFTFGMAYCSLDSATALAWIRFSYLAVPCIPAATLMLIDCLVSEGVQRRATRYAQYLAVFFVGANIFTEHLIAGTQRMWWGYSKHYGWVGWLFTVFFALAIGHCLRSLALAKRNARPGSSTARRLGLLFNASAILSLAGVDFLPGFGFEVYPFGYLPALTFVALLIYARVHCGANLLRSALAADDIVANLDEALFVLDESGSVMLANPAAQRMFGRSETRMRGKMIGELFPIPFFQSDLVGLLEKGKLSGREVLLPSDGKGGDARAVSLSASLSKDRRGNISGVVLTLTDISAQKNAEEELWEIQADLENQVAARTKEITEANSRLVLEIVERQRVQADLRQARDNLERQVTERTRELQDANTRLLELDRQKSIFLSSASHELRTPLTSVLGFSKLIERTFRRYFEPLALGTPTLLSRAKAICDNLGIIRQEGERLTLLINDLLDLNKIEAGRMEWRDAALDTRQLVHAAAARAAVRFVATPEVTFKVEIPDLLPWLYADRDRIIQVLSNLLDNAAKFTTKGSVALQALSDASSWVELRVVDSGPGVPEADRDRIFEKFYQASRPSVEFDKPRGTGLGLAISRQIVEHYGGSIWFEPGPGGRGACFVVRLPASEGDPPSLS